MRWIKNSSLILSGLMLLLNQAMADGQWVPAKPGGKIGESSIPEPPTNIWVPTKPSGNIRESSIPEPPTSMWGPAKPTSDIEESSIENNSIQRQPVVDNLNCKQDCIIETMGCNDADNLGVYPPCAKKCSPKFSSKHKKVKKALRDCEVRIQKQRYLGKIMDVLYKQKNGESTQDIRGFFVQILREKNPDGKIISYKPGKEPVVYLPYLVVLRKDVVNILSIRNSNGTIMENLDVNLDKLIEFSTLSSGKNEIKDSITQESKFYNVITARPIESKIERRIW